MRPNRNGLKRRHNVFKSQHLVLERHRYVFLLLALLIGATLACIPGAAGGPSDLELTATALVAGSNATSPPPTFTPVPGDNGAPPPDGQSTPDDQASVKVTPAPEGDTGEQGGARGTATAAVLTREANAAAAAMTAEADAQANAAILAPIEEELRSYGIDPAQGQLGWVHDPVEISVSGFQQTDWDINKVRLVRDFVVASDITWNTTFGSTGCGFVMRSDGKEENITQYLAIATRGGNGRVIFGTQIEGNLIRDDSEDIYANGIDPLFEWQNDTTNRIVVVGRGNTFSFYSNGTHLGDFTPQNVIESGLVAFVALNESGSTFCRFTNSFLWLLN